jgi:hypothetical protein
LFAFKPEQLLKGETRKRHDLFPRCKRSFLDRTSTAIATPPTGFVTSRPTQALADGIDGLTRRSKRATRKGRPEAAPRIANKLAKAAGHLAGGRVDLTQTNGTAGLWPRAFLRWNPFRVKMSFTF